jgi:hypothetical protein
MQTQAGIRITVEDIRRNMLKIRTSKDEIQLYMLWEPPTKQFHSDCLFSVDQPSGQSLKHSNANLHRAVLG